MVQFRLYWDSTGRLFDVIVGLPGRHLLFIDNGYNDFSRSLDLLHGDIRLLFLVDVFYCLSPLNWLTILGIHIEGLRSLEFLLEKCRLLYGLKSD